MSLPVATMGPANRSHQRPCQKLWWILLFLMFALLLVSLIPAVEAPPLVAGSPSKAVKEREPLWSISEFFRRKPSPGLPIPWLGLWWSLTLMRWRFVPPCPLMALPHAGSHQSPPLVPVTLRPRIVTPFVPPAWKAFLAPLASICGRLPSE